jgi:hypothetical protein
MHWPVLLLGIYVVQDSAAARWTMSCLQVTHVMLGLHPLRASQHHGVVATCRLSIHSRSPRSPPATRPAVTQVGTRTGLSEQGSQKYVTINKNADAALHVSSLNVQ